MADPDADDCFEEIVKEIKSVLKNDTWELDKKKQSHYVIN